MGQTLSMLDPNHDIVVHGIEYVQDEKFEQRVGWEAVKNMMVHDTEGNITPQLSMVSYS